MTVRRIKTTFTGIRILRLFTVLLSAFCLLLPLTAQAGNDGDGTDYYKEYTNPDTGYTAILYDEADILKDADESKILDRLCDITKYGNAIFYSAVGSSQVSASQASAMAADYFEKHFGSRADGVIVAEIMFADGSGKCMLWAETFNGIHRKVSNSDCDSIADNAVSRHSGDGIPAKYFGYADETLAQIMMRLEGQKIAQPMKVVTSALLALILGLLINFMVVSGFNRKKKPKQKEVLAGLVTQFNITDPHMVMTHTDRKYAPRSSSSSGGGGGGGGGSHGGGGHVG